MQEMKVWKVKCTKHHLRSQNVTKAFTTNNIIRRSTEIKGNKVRSVSGKEKKILTNTFTQLP
jgi:hypothetical protein